MNWMIDKSKPVIVLGITLLLCLLAGEWALRLLVDPLDYLRPQLLSDPKLGYKIQSHSAYHDAWGFRNAVVPERADVLAIGDSQTYGIGAVASKSWPAQLQHISGQSVYNLALGGYGPLQYLQLLKDKAPLLKPSVVVIGFYFGNDFWDSYSLTVQSDFWKNCVRENWASENGIQENNLKDMQFLANPDKEVLNPQVEFKPEGLLAGITQNPWLSSHSVFYRMLLGSPIAAWVWQLVHPEDEEYVEFHKEGELVSAFTPLLRKKALDMEDPDIQIGYQLSLKAWEQIKNYCQQHQIELLVALIPNKESVYSPQIQKSEKMRDVLKVVEMETQLRERFKNDLNKLQITHIDLLAPLQEASLKRAVYPRHNDSHPNANGYAVIAEAIFKTLSQVSLK